MNAIEINERLINAKKAKIKIYPCHNLRASNIGHPCERYLYLLITRWEEQKLYDAGLQSIFDLGNTMEDHTIKNIKEAGFEVITPTNRSWKIETPLITGREDIRIKDEKGELIPVEIKGLSPFVYDKLNSIEDFLNHKETYVRSYPAQLYIYMWKFEKEKGYFALTNKLTGETKFIEVPFDWQYVDALFKKAERIYEAVKTGVAPEACEDIKACDKCSLQHICGCIRRNPTDIETDGELEDLINQKEALRESKKAFEELDEEIKAKIGNREKIIAGPYFIERKCTHYPEKTETKTTPEKDVWRLNIRRL